MECRNGAGLIWPLEMVIGGFACTTCGATVTTSTSSGGRLIERQEKLRHLQLLSRGWRRITWFEILN